MLNNPQTVNPMNEYSKALKELTSKRTKTDDDQNEIFHLKFLASCYYNNKGQYFLPANMIAKSFEAGAKENKLGAKFAAIMGDDELSEGVVMLRDMAGSEQEKVPVNELISKLK